MDKSCRLISNHITTFPSKGNTKQGNEVVCACVIMRACPDEGPDPPKRYH